MRGTAWLALSGTVVSLTFTVALARRWWASRRAFLRSWTLALAAFTVGIGALTFGAAAGFTEPVVRTYYVFGALLAAPCLGLGEVELLARPQLARRVAVAVAVIAGPAALVIALQPLQAPVPGGFAVPDGSLLFRPESRALVAISNVAGTLAVLGGVVVSGVRSRGQGRPARSRFLGVSLIGLGVLVAASAGTAAGLGVPGLQPAVLAVGVAVMYGGFGQTLRRVGRHRSDGPARRRLPAMPAPGPLPDAVLSAPRWGGLPASAGDLGSGAQPA